MKRTHAPTILLSALLLVPLASAAALAQPSLVNYQGELSVSGTPFTGNASFKFAILCGTASTWSNDGTSVSGSEPAASVALSVQAGVFSVLLGDPALSMVALTGDLLESCSTPRLRVWVDTGAGFEQLTDQPLASSPFALQADVAARSIGTFTVKGDLKVANASNQTTIATDAATGQVTLSQLKFADGTIQSTAAGPSGPDPDWTVSGSNMSSIPTGTVGIGVATGAEKLHVVGNIRSDGTEGQGLVSTNANNRSARVLLGFMGDVARIRVGGAGVGSGNGLDIQTTSDRSLMRLMHNGNVGIGTTTPAALLDVAGDAQVQGNLTVQGTLNVGGVSLGGGVLSIPPNALNATDSPMEFHRSQLLLNGTTGGQGLTFEAPVYLPNGATITEYSAVLTDNNGAVASGSNIQTFLIAKPLSTAVGTIIANQSTTGAPGRVTLTQTGLSHVVDNQNNTYAVSCNWTTPATVTQMQVNGFRIVYTAGP